MTALEMDPQIRARWVAALRSGKYEQGIGYLRCDAGLCCLGVLCELAVQDFVIPLPVLEDGVWFYVSKTGSLPDAVVRWAGLLSTDPDIGGTVLSDFNDGLLEVCAADRRAVERRTFAQIADLIEGVTRP